MLIVLEGIDGAGKTSLATLLSKLLDAEIIHESKPQPFSHYYGIIKQAESRNIIADRFFWGQFVYQEPEERCLTLKRLRELENELVKSNGKLVYVTAPDEVIQNRLALREEPLSLPFDVLLGGYTWLVDTAICPIIRYDTSKGEVISNGRDLF